MTNVLVRGTALNILVLLIKLVVTFVMTPVILRAIGNYDYGIWETLVALIGYMGLLDIGIRPAISRYAALYFAEGKGRKLDELFSTSFTALTFLGIFCTMALLFSSEFLADWMAPPTGGGTNYRLLIAIVALKLFVTFPGFAFESFLEGFQKYHIKNYIIITITLVTFPVIYWMLTNGYGLLSLAVMDLVGTFVKYFAFSIYLLRKSFSPRFFRNSISLATLIELIRFGSKSFIQGVAYEVPERANSIIIAALIGPASVVFYAIPVNLIHYLRSFTWTASHALLPFFSDLNARGFQSETHRYYLFGSLLIQALILIMALGVAFLGPTFIELWVGPEYGDRTRTVLQFLLLSILMQIINPFGSRYLTAIDKHGIYAKWGPVGGVCQVGISVTLVYYLRTVESAVAAGLIVSAALFPVYFLFCMRNLKMDPMLFLRLTVGRLVWPLTIAGAFLFAVTQFVVVDSLILLFSISGLALVIYLPLVFALSFDEHEKQSVRRVSKAMFVK